MIEKFSSGAPLEETVGYSRMIKVDSLVMIGGTTSVQPDGSVYGEGSAYEQTKYILKKQIALLEQAGGKVSDVVRVFVYATSMSESKEISQAYSELFQKIKPLCTVVGINELNRASQKVEIEMMAIIQPDGEV